MATLTIKNIPEPLVKRFKKQAAAHRRSLNYEVISYLEQMTHSLRGHELSAGYRKEFD